MEFDEKNINIETETENAVPVSVIEDDVQDDYGEETDYSSNSSRMRAFLEKKQEEEKPAEPEKKKKRGIFAAVGKFIYYHKLISIIIAAVLVFFAVKGISAVTKKSYDYNIGIYTCEFDPTDKQCGEIAEYFRSYGRDIDGDGKITVCVEAYHPFTGNYFQRFPQEMKLRRDIYGDWKYGDRVNHILIVDETGRDIIFGSGGQLLFDQIKGEERWACVGGTALAESAGGILPDDLGIMLLSKNYYNNDQVQAKRDHNKSLALLEAIGEDNPGLFDMEEK